MKIKNKIILSFLLVVVIGGGLALFFVDYISQNAFKDSIGQNSVVIAEQTIDAVDRIIYRRLERWESYLVTHPDISENLQSSLNKFASFEDPLAYIAEQDQLWLSTPINETTPLMEEVMDNSQAENFRDLMAFYENQYGYRLFPEVFISNKYGAIVASSGRTSDYNQADEIWWQQAKANKFFVSNVNFDESSGIYAIDICLRIDDGDGNFLGVMKAVFDIKEIIDVINETAFGEADKRTTDQAAVGYNSHESMSGTLIDEDGRLIYSTVGAEDRQANSISSELLQLIHSSNKKYFIAASDKEGSHQILYSFANSRGYRDYQSQGWIFVLEHDTREVYASVQKLSNSIFFVILLCCLICIFLSIFLSRAIFKPIVMLQENIKKVASGDFNTKINVKGSDEISDLANTFNKMVVAIKKSRAEVDIKVEEQTKEINQKARDLEKQRLAILNVLEDVELEKNKSQRLAKDLKKFQLAVAHASDHIVITDQDGFILYGNEAVERITGFSNKEVIGKKAGGKDLWGGLMEKEFYKTLWKTIKINKRPFAGYVHNKRKNGQEYDAEAHISPIVDERGEVKFFVGIERDVTKERDIDRAKTEFVSLASHQLRTPLSAINWYAEMLLSGDAGKINKEQKDYIQEIYQGNQRMVDLVNSLLNVSRIDMGTLAIEPVPTSLVELAQSVVKELQPQIKEKKQDIGGKYDKSLPKINIDPKMMRIVLQNLMSNAVKYTPDKGKISLDIKKEAKNAIIKVKDNGYGIPKPQQSKIFSKLFRADNIRDKKTDGTGLGLYVVKSVVEQFNGKIWFESVENKGTTFYVSIPLSGVKKKEGTKGLEYTK